MKNNVKSTALILTGMVISTSLSPVASAAAEYFQAQRTAHPIYVDGRQVQLEAYAINGSNYVKLRDIGEAVGFEVYWDGAATQVLRDKPYTGETPRVEDYSQVADPSIFTDGLTKELYNGLRDAILHQDEILAGQCTPRSLPLNYDRQYTACVTCGFSNYPVFELKTQSDGQSFCEVRIPETYTPAAEHTQSFIDSLAGLSDRDKVEKMVWYVADRITYAIAYPCPHKVLTQDGQVPGCCAAYAHSFMFLCNRAGIPCIFKVGGNHEWNIVYVEGKWWDVDVTANDCEDNIAYREDCTILRDPAEVEMAGYHDEYPQLTAFTQELLAPGAGK